MGSQNCSIVGKSQSVRLMIDPIIFPRTRRYPVTATARGVAWSEDAPLSCARRSADLVGGAPAPAWPPRRCSGASNHAASSAPSVVGSVASSWSAVEWLASALCPAPHARTICICIYLHLFAFAFAFAPSTHVRLRANRATGPRHGFQDPGGVDVGVWTEGWVPIQLRARIEKHRDDGLGRGQRRRAGDGEVERGHALPRRE
jgi:hypothetical protein